MKTAKDIIRELPLSINDVARLAAETAEEIGETARGLERLEMLRMLRRIIRAGIAAIRAEENTVTFAEAAWASIKARTGRRATTLRDLRHFVRRMLRMEGIGERPLRAMNTQECRVLLIRVFGNSHHSFNKGRAILHSIFAYGQRQEWCSDNPVARIEKRQVTEREIIPLTPEEIQRLEDTAKEPKHREMQLSLHLMLYGGIRPAEVSRLCRENIQEAQNRVIIPARSSKTGGGRAIPIRHKKRLKGMSMSIPRNWQKRWRELRRAAGFRQWQPDVCRHTFASYHAAYFRNLGELQLEMGHRSAELLRSRYLNLPRIDRAEKYWN